MTWSMMDGRSAPATTKASELTAMPDRPNFAAIAQHQRTMHQLGGGLTVEYLDQVVRYALELEMQLAELRDGRTDNRQAQAADPPWPPRVRRRG
jgi:hypothetical protein